MEKTRKQWIDIAKAVGIIVVLLVHTEFDLGFVTKIGGLFYMPLFFVVAGYTFTYRDNEDFGTFAARKARRLLIPYFGYNLCLFAFFFLKDSVLAGSISASSFFPLLGILYSRNCLYPMSSAENIYFMQILNSPTWFLTCIFITYLLFWLVLKASKGSLKASAACSLAMFAAAAVLHYFCPVLLPWSVDCALYAVSFMFFGYFAKEKEMLEWFRERPYMAVLPAVVFLVTGWINGSVNMSVGEYGRSMLLYLAVGTSGALIVMLASVLIDKLRTIAGFSYIPGLLGFLGRHTVPVLCLHLFVYSVMGTIVGFIC